MIYTKIDEKDVTKENPLIMYTIVKESLGMSAGKLLVQAQHGIQILLEQYDDLETIAQSNGFPATTLTEEEVNIITRMELWKDSKKHNSGIRKVSLGGSDKEFEKVKSEFGSSLALVRDAGLTQVPSGSETVIVLYPLFRGENKTIKRLQVLK